MCAERATHWDSTGPAPYGAGRRSVCIGSHHGKVRKNGHCLPAQTCRDSWYPDVDSGTARPTSTVGDGRAARRTRTCLWCHLVAVML